MSSLHYLILSFIQAATEFLPISSSGHLLFLKGLFEQSDIPIIFDVVVHVGSLIAIIVFYRKRFVEALRNGFLEWKEKREKRPHIRLVFYIFLSTVVTFVFYLFMLRLAQHMLLSCLVIGVVVIC